MTADDPGSLRRWLACGLLMVCAHGAIAGWLVRLSDAMPSGAPTEAIVVDLSPLTESPAETPLLDVPQAMEAEKSDPPAEPVMEQRPVEQAPEASKPEVALARPLPELPPPPKAVKEHQPRKIKPQATKTAAPRPPTRVAELTPHPGVPSPTANPAARASWHLQVVSQIERNKRYPADAQQRGDRGVTRVSFSLDRSGRVLSAGIAGGSSFAALDQESLATIRRAAPFPPPPADVPGSIFSFTVPIRYTKQ